MSGPGLSRRRLLGLGLTGLGLGALPTMGVASLAGAAPSAPAGGTDPLTMATWEPLMGETFTIERFGGDNVEVTLTTVTDRRRDTTQAGDQQLSGEAFCLTFRSMADHGLEQNTYTLLNSRLGRCAVFMAPADPTTLYVSVNRQMPA